VTGENAEELEMEIVGAGVEKKQIGGRGV